MTSVRRLNDAGIDAYAGWLGGEAPEPAPLEILSDPATSTAMDVSIDARSRAFADKLELGTFLVDLLKPIATPAIELDRGLWNWLSLYYFDQLRPKDKNGSPERLRKRTLYLAEPGRADYRHLLIGPYALVRRFGADAQGYLRGFPINAHPDFLEQTLGRQYFTQNRGMIAVIRRLYVDEATGSVKRGVTSKEKAGGIRRLANVVAQFDVNYDLFGMQTDEILAMLPKEFLKWLDAPHESGSHSGGRKGRRR